MLSTLKTKQFVVLSVLKYSMNIEHVVNNRIIYHLLFTGKQLYNIFSCLLEAVVLHSVQVKPNMCYTK
jgi:hypothetical protein